MVSYFLSYCVGSFTWSKITNCNLLARAGHQLLSRTKSEASKNEEIFVFGGGDNEGKFFNDLSLLPQVIC